MRTDFASQSTGTSRLSIACSRTKVKLCEVMACFSVAVTSSRLRPGTRRVSSAGSAACARPTKNESSRSGRALSSTRIFSPLEFAYKQSKQPMCHEYDSRPPGCNSRVFRKLPATDIAVAMGQRMIFVRGAPNQDRNADHPGQCIGMMRQPRYSVIFNWLLRMISLRSMSRIRGCSVR